MFIICYALARIIASKAYWTNTYGDGGQTRSTTESPEGWALVLALTFLYIWTGYHVLPEAMMNASVHFSLPPYVDDGNWATALLCQQHADGLVKGFRESELPSPTSSPIIQGGDVEMDLPFALDTNQEDFISTTGIDAVGDGIELNHASKLESPTGGQ